MIMWKNCEMEKSLKEGNVSDLDSDVNYFDKKKLKHCTILLFDIGPKITCRFPPYNLDVSNSKIPKHDQSNAIIGNCMVMDQNISVNFHQELVPPLKKKLKRNVFMTLKK